MTDTPQKNLSPFPPTPNDEESTTFSKQLPEDGSFNVAGIAQWMAQRAMQKDPTLEPRVRGAIRGIVGSQFSDQELRALEERALRNAGIGDALTLQGLAPGATVQLSPRQKTSIDGLMNKLGEDDLAKRARDAYGAALQNGKIVVH